MSATRRLGLGALALGLAAPFVGSPFRPHASGLDIDGLVKAIDDGADHVGARALAGWIRERRPGLRVIDVRPSEAFGDDAIPTAENLPLDRLVRTAFAPDQTVVLYSQEGAHAGQAWVLLRALGVAHVTFVAGGLADWWDEVMAPAIPADMPSAERETLIELSRFFGGSPRFSAHGEAPAPTPHRRRGC
ncbi:rhodanese-like domain-containing protein [Caulobacter sp. 1776]|uniref:rhodanese-like domain-containing protein n=1 Tax=Caulobacter sp. 1776 TaxID=3156420 RepID=UPI00339142B7